MRTQLSCAALLLVSATYARVASAQEDPRVTIQPSTIGHIIIPPATVTTAIVTPSPRPSPVVIAPVTAPQVTVPAASINHVSIPAATVASHAHQGFRSGPM